MSLRRSLASTAAVLAVVIGGAVSGAAPALATDTTPPTVHITKPPLALRPHVSAWQVVKGTAHDSESGVGLVLVMALERRSGIWYGYDYSAKVWRKGYADLQKTLGRNKAVPAFPGVSSTGAWRAPRFVGLRKGKLLLRATAWDTQGNMSTTAQVTQLLTAS